MFTKYIETFLSLLERFVVATERRNELIANAKSNGVSIKEEATAQAQKEDAQTGNNPADTGGTSRGSRSRSSAAGADTKPDDTPPAGNGRRSRVRAADVDQNADSSGEKEAAGTESTAGAGSAGGRRTRTRAADVEKKPEPPKDTPEQAEDREEVENLCRMAAENDDANADVKQYFSEEGWANGLAIPADKLVDALNEINDILDKYFKD